MSKSFIKNPEILDCNLCFERYSDLCPEHKLSIAFKEDDYLKKCVDLLIEDRLLSFKKDLPSVFGYKYFKETQQ